MAKLPTDKCTGCTTCYNICPKKAISMNENSEGFLYPAIDELLCVKCGLCEKYCPVNNPVKCNHESDDVYAAWNESDSIRIDSSSGGVFDAIAREILDKGGVVYGAAWDKSKTDLKHIRINDIQKLGLLRKSKYLQSSLDDCFVKVKNDLINGETVLFSGTPCQIAGLRSYLQNQNTAQLYTVEILCHGVPSKKVIDNYLDMMEKRHNKVIKEIRFRHKDKEHSWRNSCCCYCICDDGTILYDENTLDSIFWSIFLNNVCLRKSCSTCNYAKRERVSDITLGDFWGIWEDSAFSKEINKGVSLVLLNNNKGNELFKSCQKIMARKADKELAYEHNLTLTKPFSASLKRTYFFNNLGKVRFDKLVKRTFRKRFLILKIKKILGESLSSKVSSYIHKRESNE